MKSRREAFEAVGNRFRDGRFGPFLDFVDAEQRPLRVLDCGGTEAFWLARGFGERPDVEITLLNLSAAESHTAHISCVSGDATNLSQFADDSFDIAFSNSVIEHLHDFESQRKMAAELRRVGVRHFVQTPNKWFFLEPHYLLPGFQFLPASVAMAILTKTRLSRGRKWPEESAQQYVDEIRLLSLSEMRELFPQSELYREKFLGMSKSFTLHNMG